MTVSRRRRSLLGVAGATLMSGALVSGFAGNATAATASGTPYGGFTTSATATPLRLEIFEPAIPIPASPEAELNFSYTTVSGSSGPDSTALASAMWPGDAVGNGLPTILTQLGAPSTLLPNGYPVHVNAQYPGTPNSGSQEFLPGMVGRVSGSDKQAVARAGYSTSGQVAGDSTSGTGLSSVLDQLKSGDLGALGGLLSGPNSNSDTGSNPLGVLSAVVSVGGMSSSSVTDYSDPSTVTASATSEIGNINLLGGLVSLSGVNVSSVSSSGLDAGGQATQKVTYGSLTIAGQAFKLTSDGIEASGKTTKTPDTSALAALSKLGITIDIPKPTKTVSGDTVTTSASGPVITIDTQPVISLLQLGKLPLGDLINKLPASANQVKGVLLAALQAHPKIVVALGEVSSSAQTIAAVNIGGGGGGGGVPGAITPGGTISTGGTGVPGSTGITGTPGTTSPQSGTPNSGYHLTSSTPGLPPLGSVPGMLLVGGLILAAALAWFFRAAALSALGAGSTCTHGLATGLPDLRKA